MHRTANTAPLLAVCLAIAVCGYLATLGAPPAQAAPSCCSQTPAQYFIPCESGSCISYVIVDDCVGALSGYVPVEEYTYCECLTTPFLTTPPTGISCEFAAPLKHGVGTSSVGHSVKSSAGGPTAVGKGRSGQVRKER